MRKIFTGVLFVLMLALTAYCASASISVSPTSLTFSGDFGVTVNKTLVVSNTGANSTTVGLTANDLSGFDFTYSSNNFVLAAGANRTVTISLTLPVKNAVIYNGTIVVSDASTSRTIATEVDLTKAETLVITKVEIDGDTTRNGETFNNLKPLDVISIEITVANNYENADDTIENIMATITLVNIDNAGDDDIELETDEIELDGGDDDTLEAEFTVPYDVDDSEDYRVEIFVEGEGTGDNNDGDDYEVEWTVYVAPDKEKNTLAIMDYSISPETVTCGIENVDFEVTAADIGSNDQSDAVVQVKNAALGLDKKTSSFNMDSDPDKSDFEVTKTLAWQVPANLKAGSYTVDFYLYFDDDKQVDHKTGTLVVEKCSTTAATVTNTTTTATPTYQSGTTSIQPGISYSAEDEGSSLRSSPLYLATLIVVLIAALVLIVFLILKMVGII